MAGGSRASVLVLHRHALVRQVLAVVLESPQRVVVALDAGDPGVEVETYDAVLIEHRLLTGDGPWPLRVREAGTTPFLALADGGPSTREELARATEAGARAWVSHDSTLEQLEAVLLAVAGGAPAEPPDLAPPISCGRPQRPVRLTPRESSVLQLLASGQSTREISQALDLAPNTVRTYRQRLFHKLDVHTAVEAVVRGRAEQAPAADQRAVTLRDGTAYVVPGSGAVLLGGTAGVRALPTLPDMRDEAPLSPRPGLLRAGEPTGAAAGTQAATKIALGDRDAGTALRDAAKGDQSAWDQIVSSYVGLVWSVARSCGLSASDTSDVVQTTWLRLVENVDRIEDPNRLGAWLSTTARRECLRLIAKSRRTTPVATIDVLTDERGPASPAPDAGLLDRERDAQVQAAIARLPAHCQQLLQQLMQDPRPSYSTIAATLQMPIGSIGPTRGRCLRRLQLLLGESSVAHTDVGDLEDGGR